MSIDLSPTDLEIKERARAFTEKALFPFEMELQETGKLSSASDRDIRQSVIDYRLNAINHGTQVGGQGYTAVQQTLVNEEIGKASNSLWLMVWQPPLCLQEGTQQQIDEYLRPSCLGEKTDAYVITEPQGGSDAGNVQTTAVQKGDRFIVNGRKCFSSGSEFADYVLLHASVDGDPRKAVIFLVDPRAPGFNITRLPKFVHHGPWEHPEVSIENLELESSCILGKIGEGFELTKQWFIEARLAIGARCVGAAIRASELARAFVLGRTSFGKPLFDHQSMEFSFADMAVDIMAAKSLLYRVAAEIDHGIDPKLAHARVSAVKLFCSEMAGRVTDRAVQAMGGRGFYQDNPVARLVHDVRYERIWEGTSEIQRMIIGAQVRKRGLGVFSE